MNISIHNQTTAWDATYDATNRRVSKTAFGITTVFIYDLFGNLIGEYTTGGGLIRDYVYLGSKPIALISLPEGIHIGPVGCPSICNINAGAFRETSNSLVGSRHVVPDKGGVLNVLIYLSPLWILTFIRIYRKGIKGRVDLPGLILITGVVSLTVMVITQEQTEAQTSQENIYYYHLNHLGTPIRMTDANQAIAWDATYDPFGKASITTASVTNNIRFPGQYYDMETGLHYNWHRYYWPEVGRYVEAGTLDIGTYKIIVNTLTAFLNNIQRITMMSIYSQGILYKMAEVKIQNLPLPLFGGTFKDLSFDQNLLLQPIMLSAYPYVVNNPLRVTDELGLYACLGCAPKCSPPKCPDKPQCPKAEDCYKWYYTENARCAITCPGRTAGTAYVACQQEAYRCLALCLSWTGE